LPEGSSAASLPGSAAAGEVFWVFRISIAAITLLATAALFASALPSNLRTDRVHEKALVFSRETELPALQSRLP
jgi:hypothetical protein